MRTGIHALLLCAVPPENAVALSRLLLTLPSCSELAPSDTASRQPLCKLSPSLLVAGPQREDKGTMAGLSRGALHELRRTSNTNEPGGCSFGCGHYISADPACQWLISHLVLARARPERLEQTPFFRVTHLGSRKR